jgi:periplasmic divalent cation tolerance protein
VAAGEREMTPARNFRLLLVTAPDRQTARRLARAALRARLIACANLIPGVESHYWWREKLERGSEVLLVLKTTVKRVANLEKLILAEHPYDTPEFLVLPLMAGSPGYLAWLAANTGAAPRPLRKSPDKEIRGSRGRGK